MQTTFRGINVVRDGLCFVRLGFLIMSVVVMEVMEVVVESDKDSAIRVVRDPVIPAIRVIQGDVIPLVQQAPEIPVIVVVAEEHGESVVEVVEEVPVLHY
jgi:hypothetical protein